MLTHGCPGATQARRGRPGPAGSSAIIDDVVFW
jgi:hypothetical protein